MARSVAPKIAIRPAKTRMDVDAKKDALRPKHPNNLNIDNSIVPLKHLPHPSGTALCHRRNQIRPVQAFEFGKFVVTSPPNEEPDNGKIVQLGKPDK